MNKVKLGFVALTGVPTAVAESDYLEWYAMRHMPEQLALTGLVSAQRWHSTPACREQRAAQSADLTGVENVVQYLMEDPADLTFERFIALNKELNETGRYIAPSPQLMEGCYDLLVARAAAHTMISDEALPWRPNLGIYLIVERIANEADGDQFRRELLDDRIPALLDIPGVAGVWSFGTSPRHQHPGLAKGDFRLIFCYLDREPALVGSIIAPMMTARWKRSPFQPVFAGPFESLVEWNWARFTSG